MSEFDKPAHERDWHWAEEEEFRTLTAERDEARAQFDRHVEWAADKRLTVEPEIRARAEAFAALTPALRTLRETAMNLAVYADYMAVGHTRTCVAELLDAARALLALVPEEK